MSVLEEFRKRSIHKMLPGYIIPDNIDLDELYYMICKYPIFKNAFNNNVHNEFSPTKYVRNNMAIKLNTEIILKWAFNTKNINLLIWILINSDDNIENIVIVNINKYLWTSAAFKYAGYGHFYTKNEIIDILMLYNIQHENSC
jgi:hypothetical protein